MVYCYIKLFWENVHVSRKLFGHFDSEDINQYCVNPNL